MKLHDITPAVPQNRQNLCAFMDLRFPHEAPFLWQPDDTITYGRNRTIPFTLQDGDITYYQNRADLWARAGALPHRAGGY